jgi:hypothetical protein
MKVPQHGRYLAGVMMKPRLAPLCIPPPTTTPLSLIEVASSMRHPLFGGNSEFRSRVTPLA